MLARVLSGLWALSVITAVGAIPTISIKGNKFFTDDGNQFFVKGVAYQLSESDPLVDMEQCARDAKLMQSLGANTIRVYHVNQGDHSGCMQVFSDAGIYAFIDLDTFSTQIEGTHPTWNSTQQRLFEAVMDEFHSFDNVAGFFVGNEVITTGNESVAALYVKAAARDIKAYRDSKGYRNIGVGYSHADISSLRPNLQNYLTCGDDPSESVDFFGLNAYEWCGNNDFITSGYTILNQQVQGFPVPIFLSEDGCITPRPRTFEDQFSVLGPDMDQTWSGAIIYEWIQEVNGYGLISYGGMTDAAVSIAPTADIVRSGTPTPVSPDFSNLKSVWAAVTPSSISQADYSPSLTPPPCPGYTAGLWEINGNQMLPMVNQVVNTQAVTAGEASPTAAAPSPSSTAKKSAASGRREVLGMGIGLAGVLLGFVLWL